MTTILLPHVYFDADHLAEVAEVMATMGSPKLRGFAALDMIQAIEPNYALEKSADSE
ncbi:MAG: hypothetical protein J0H94_12965 [Rhizobiales bacterium]|nr:hypothetical protein [Hyphomicrobiales bacterium]